MKIEYDAERDLMYIRFKPGENKTVTTMTITPGVYADIDKNGDLLGLELIDASEYFGDTMHLDLDIPLPQKAGVLG